MGEAGEEEDGVWPPPPARPPLEEAGVEPKIVLATDCAIGRVSLGLSGLGSLCGLVFALSFNERAGGWDPFWLEIVFGGCFILGLFSGIMSWRSREGKVGLGLAVIAPPLWIMVAFLVSVAHSP